MQKKWSVLLRILSVDVKKPAIFSFLRIFSQLEKQPPEVYYKKAVFKYFSKFIRKKFVPEPSFNKVAGIWPETVVQVFSCEFKNTFFTEHIRTTTSAFTKEILSGRFYILCRVHILNNVKNLLRVHDKDIYRVLF